MGPILPAGRLVRGIAPYARQKEIVYDLNVRILPNSAKGMTTRPTLKNCQPVILTFSLRRAMSHRRGCERSRNGKIRPEIDADEHSLRKIGVLVSGLDRRSANQSDG